MKNKGKKLFDYSWKRYLVSFFILVLLIGVLVVILRVEEDYTVLSSYEKSDTSRSLRYEERYRTDLYGLHVQT